MFFVSVRGALEEGDGKEGGRRVRFWRVVSVGK